VLQAAAGRRNHVDVYGVDYDTRDGTCVRDYIHVRDLAAAHVRALEALTDHDRLICNLGNGTGFTVREVIDAARDVTGLKVGAREAPRREGDPPVLVASADHARTVLDWQPQITDLEDILASAWRWHRARWSEGK
jgi:UDP-glucose 4-epimerase